jgi:integrase/recombinase XerD
VAGVVKGASARSLTPFIDGFGMQLLGRGYSRGSIEIHLRFCGLLDRWLTEEGIGVGELTPAVAERFLVARRAEGHRTMLSMKSVGPLFDYLGGLGVFPSREVPLNEAGLLLEDYRRYLLGERGLADQSIAAYVRVAARFLDGCSEPLRDEFECLSGVQINAFVLLECEGRGVALGKVVVRSLRSFLRFLHVEGWLSQSLLETVPQVANRASVLPRAPLSPERIVLLLDSCDRSTVRGSRDFAILTILSRLGLRAGEVTALELGDIDWRAGEMLVHGKGSRLERMPLPPDVGEAIVQYLRFRPRSPERAVFLRTLAPLAALSRSAVTSIVARACVRAGVPRVGPHRLRHSVACELLQRGAALPEIAQLLRHRSLLATSIYAKAQPEALRDLALAWPGGQS